MDSGESRKRFEGTIIMSTKESRLIKEIIEDLVSEKEGFMNFIMDKKLDGEFIKYCQDRTKKLAPLKFNFDYEDGDEDGIRN